MRVKIEVYGSRIISEAGPILPTRALIRDRQWAERLVKRFNRRQERIGFPRRAIAIIATTV